jgi:TPR repeat protein
MPFTIRIGDRRRRNADRIFSGTLASKPGTIPYTGGMKRPMSRVSGLIRAFVFASIIAVRGQAAGVGPQTDPGPSDSNPIAELKHDAEQGNPKAQYILGCCYNGDHGFTRDPAEAAIWWRKAAANGVANAQFCLGLSFFAGEGVPKNMAEAAKWWKMAAEQGHPDAQYFLGLCYSAGLGAPKSTAQAIFWLQKAASHGIQAASKLLSQMGPPAG